MLKKRGSGVASNRVAVRTALEDDQVMGGEKMFESIRQWAESHSAGSVVALFLGWFFLIAGIGTIGQNDNAVFGVVVLLGTYAYRSAKKRKLGLKKDTTARKAGEMGLLLLMLALILCRPDAGNRMIDHPIGGILAPAWALTAYGVAWRRRTTKER